VKARRRGSIYKEPGCNTWTIAYRRDGKRMRGARQMRGAGVPESIVQAIGGWKTAETFRRYAIVSPADQQAAIKMLEQAREKLGRDLGRDCTENPAATIPDRSGKVQ